MRPVPVETPSEGRLSQVIEWQALCTGLVLGLLFQIATVWGAEPGTITKRLPAKRSSSPGTVKPARTARTGGSSAATDPTWACWTRINEIIAQETKLRAAPAEITAANAGKFLHARTRAANYATTSLSALNLQGVAPELAAHVTALAQWYREEERLSDRAAVLLTKENVQSRGGAAENSWKAAEEQHRHACEELNRAGDVLRQLLSQRYHRQFPPLL